MVDEMSEMDYGLKEMRWNMNNEVDNVTTIIFIKFQKTLRKTSLFHMKITVSVTKTLHQDCGPCYLHLPIFFFYIHSSLLQQNKKLLRLLFSLANYTTDHYLVITRNSSVGIGFDMNNKHQILPIVYTMLI